MTATLGELFLSFERAHDRAAAVQERRGDRLVRVPDWRFLRHVVRIGLYLRERAGLEAGGAVALIAAASIEALVVEWACVTQGAAAVTVDPRVSAPALVRAWSELAPRAAFVAGEGAIERVRALPPSAPGPARIVTFDAVRSEHAASFCEALDLGGTLDTAERANAMRKRAGEIEPAAVALAHVAPRGEDGLDITRISHAGALVCARHATPRAGDVAYVRASARALAARAAVLGFVGDGRTTTLLGDAAHEREDIAAARPRWIVDANGARERSAPARALERFVERVRARATGGA